MTERPRIQRPQPWPVIAGALAVFFAVLLLLAFQSREPRVSPVPAAYAPLAAVPPPRQVLLRRVIVTRVITEIRHDDAPERTPIQIVSAPASSAPAPVASAPAPAPATTAPAPAPAPAPLTTRTS